MKRLITALITASLLLSSAAQGTEDILQLAQDYHNQTYDFVPEEEDVWFTTQSASLLAWGVGLTALIAIVVALIPQSTAETSNPCEPCADVRVTEPGLPQEISCKLLGEILDSGNVELSAAPAKAHLPAQEISRRRATDCRAVLFCSPRLERGRSLCPLLSASFAQKRDRLVR